jgi:hypothetical protein
MAYINGNTKRQDFLPECEGFFIEQCSWLPNEDFLRIPRQGTRVCAYSAKIKVLECVQNSKVHMHKSKEIITAQMQRDKISLFIVEIPTSLVQSNQKACSAQTGDEWIRQWHRRGRRGAPG